MLNAFSKKTNFAPTTVFLNYAFYISLTYTTSFITKDNICFDGQENIKKKSST